MRLLGGHDFGNGLLGIEKVEPKRADLPRFVQSPSLAAAALQLLLPNRIDLLRR